MCRVPRWRRRTAASRVARTIASGSLPGTKVVTKATLLPFSGTTGTGSRATSVAWALDVTLISRKSSIRPMDISITASQATIQPGAFSRRVQWAGCISQTSSTAESTGAAPSSSAARIRWGSSESRLRYFTRYGTPGSGSVSGPASLL